MLAVGRIRSTEANDCQRNVQNLPPLPTAHPIRHTTSDGTRIAAVSSTSRGLAYCAVIEGGQAKVIDNQPDRNLLLRVQRVSTTSARGGPRRACCSRRISCSRRVYCSRRVRRLSHLPNRRLQSRRTAERKLQAASSNGSIYAQTAAMRFSAADRVRLAIVANGPESCQTEAAVSALQHVDNPAAATLLEQAGNLLPRARRKTTAYRLRLSRPGFSVRWHAPRTRARSPRRRTSHG